MPTKLNSKLTVALLTVAALLALPAAAQATLAFVRYPLHSTVYLANDNGSGAHKIGPGRDPRVSPDGQSVVYLYEGRGGTPQEMKLAPVAGGPSRTLMVNWQESFYLAFSPDSSTIAALRGPENGARKLVLIDLASGAQRVVASGYFSGFSFSPNGTELVYSKAGTEHYPPRSDVYRVATSGGNPVRLTHDRNSEDPLWGPSGEIVFVKLLGASQRRYGPKNELYLMNSSGGQVRRLTHTKVDPLVQGLIPTAWSASGNQLLAEFGGQDTSYAVTVNPKTGAERTLTKERESGFIGAALSRDGTTVLGSTGGFEPGPNHDVAAVPYAGGKPKVLAKNAYEPSWSR
jgi:dipeptidyl aminopeptidase/acylaminoacyl peptidase